MRNLVADFPALTNDDDGISASQALGAAGVLLINGALVTNGVAISPYAQIVSITSGGNDTGITFTLAGQDPDGTAITQVVTGASGGAAVSTRYFKTITSITVSGAVATVVKVGWIATNGAMSRSLRHNGQQEDFKVDYVMRISGTLTASAQYCLDQPEDAYAVSYSVSADWRNVDGLTAVTASAVSNIFYKANCSRLLISAYTSGTAKLTCGQSY